MNPHYTYFIILLASLAGPLILSFDKKVRFYTKWKFALPAMILPAVLYILWDNWFTRTGVWSFNPRYTTGNSLFGLPVEEVLFFLVIPYCCIFIYECVRNYFPEMKCTKASDYILGITALLLLVSGLLLREKIYTATTSLFTALFIAVILCFRRSFHDFHTAAFLVSYGIILFPFLVVNGFLTAIPVVLYNDAENSGLRIYSIPVEDIFYGMLLVMMNIVIYEKLRIFFLTDCTDSTDVLKAE